jgi:hypothetical protein
MKHVSSNCWPAMSWARCRTLTGPGAGRARTNTVNWSVGTHPVNAMSNVAGGNASTANSSDTGSNGAPCGRESQPRSSPRPAWATHREPAAVRFEAHLDLLHDVYPHAVGRLRFETDAVLIGDVGWRRQPTVPMHDARGIQIAGGEQSLDAHRASLRQPRPYLTGRTARSQHLGMQCRGPGLGRSQVVGARRVDMGVAAGRQRNTTEHGQEIAAVRFPADRPVRTHLGVEPSRADLVECAHHSERGRQLRGVGGAHVGATRAVRSKSLGVAPGPGRTRTER